MRSGQVCHAAPQLAASKPAEVLGLLYRANWREVILLDLSRVGTGTGVDQALIAEARQMFPQLMLLAVGACGMQTSSLTSGQRVWQEYWWPPRYIRVSSLDNISRL